MVIGFGLIGILLIFSLGRLLRWPLKILVKVLVNGIIGCFLLYVLNVFTRPMGFTLPITKLSALIAGFFGLPGILVMLVFRYLV